MHIRVIALFAAALLTVVSSSAQARHHHRHHRVDVVYSTDEGRIVAHPTGCPHFAFCGCGTSVRLFGYPIRPLFLATNWRRFPSAPCAAGNAAWRPGHVFAIESCNGDGTAVAYDPNSGGHKTRIHTVSLHRYHVVNPHGLHMARQ